METKNQSQNAGKVYLCPMHPEVRQPNPGKCPKCVGMYLVPEGSSRLRKFELSLV